MKAQRAFTLIELLVVIAILGILAALLLPVLSKAKNQGAKTTDLNNLKQIMIAVQVYASENDDRVPPPNWDDGHGKITGWLYQPSPPTTNSVFDVKTGLLWPILLNAKLYFCPMDGPNVTGFDDRPQQISSYAMNGAVIGYAFDAYSFNAGNLNDVQFHGTNFVEPGIAGLKLSSIKNPSRTVLVAEMPAFIPYSWHQPKRPFSKANSIFNDSKNMVGFVDGHVNYIKMFWDGTWLALAHDPPAGYDYQWSGNKIYETRIHFD